MTFALSHTTKTYPKQVPYERIARDILGARFNVSLVFIGEERARTLNISYRKKDYVPNVLTFPLDNHEGEIYICSAEAKRQAKKFGMSFTGFVGYLFIHGLLHLKGCVHGSAMEAKEDRAVKEYGLI